MTAPVTPPAVPRQLASNVFRLVAAAGVGSGAVIATGMRMDRKYRDNEPSPNGTPGVIDRQEARDLVFGHKSMTQ